MRTAEITLLHKKNARTNFANYRPISLLNCDYKILSRALCIALKPVIASLVHPDQTGFIPGRLISDNGLLFYFFSINGIYYFLKGETTS